MTERPSRRRPRPAMKALVAIGALARLAQGQVCDQSALSAAAVTLLAKNYNADLQGTTPSASVDPALLATDSAFAAYAFSHYDLQKGMAEMQTILRSQWSNGVIPKIQFPPRDPGATWWQGTIYPGPAVWNVPPSLVPQGHATSGVAAAPWFAHVAMQIFNQNRNAEGLNFLSSVFKPIFYYHQYLHTMRDAGGGLVYSYHPWESDMPVDSPVWTEALKATQDRISKTGWKCPWDLAGPSSLPGAPSVPVLTSEMYLAQLISNTSYDDIQIQQTTPFLVVDVQFNAILASADISLAKMAQTLQLHSTATVDEATRSITKGWWDSAQSRFTYLWDGYRYASLLVPPQAEPLLDDNSNQVPGAMIKRSTPRKIKIPPQVTPAASIATNNATRGPPKGTFYTTDVVSNFSPLYVGNGVAGSALQGLLFQMLTPQIPASFVCPDDTYRLPTSACSVKDPRAVISVLENFIVQRGLAKNEVGGLNVWLANQTVNRICNASMDPFAPGSSSSEKAQGPFHFSRYFNPVDGTPVEDMWGTDTTLAAAVTMVLLYPDAKIDAGDAPPISHDATFALVVIELIIAFATGVSCFVFSLNLFRRLHVTDSDTPMPMLNVQEIEEEEEEHDGRDSEAGVGTATQYYTFPDGTEPPPCADTNGADELRRSESAGQLGGVGGGGRQAGMGGGGPEEGGGVHAVIRFFKFW